MEKNEEKKKKAKIEKEKSVISAVVLRLAVFLIYLKIENFTMLLISLTYY